MQLAEVHEKFEAVGVNVAAMTTDKVRKLERFSKKYDIQYPLLYDKAARHVNAFRIRNHEFKPGHMAYGVPHPGVIFISPTGQILAKAAIGGYRKRPKFKDLFEMVIKALRQQQQEPKPKPED